MRTLAVIPARGGSTGILRKNLQLLAGRSLVARAVTAARLAETIDLVVVSTDDHEIARTAQASGAEVVVRPKKLASDSATSESAVLHVLDTLDATCDVVVLIQCTSPFIEPSDIDDTVALVGSGEADCAFTATPFNGFLWHSGDSPAGVNHVHTQRLRRQDREIEYLETGAVYAMRVDGFRAARHRFFGTIAIHEVPRHRALEIDSVEDLELARAVVQIGMSEDSAVGPIAAVALDFDGVLTNNRVVVTEDGREAVICDRSDGFGISMMRDKGLHMLVLSSETNSVVAQRCTKLGIPWKQGVTDKAGELKKWLGEVGVEPERAAFIGNDVNDLEAMRSVRFSLAPSDAQPEVLREAAVILTAAGGCGAVREFARRVISVGSGEVV